MPIIQHLLDVVQGKCSLSTPRSGKWPTVREQHLAEHPVCEVCGGTAKLEVHHIRPFHLHPELELEPANLVTLCEAHKEGINCHLLFGHLGNFRSFNAEVLADAGQWARKIKGRPLQEGRALPELLLILLLGGCAGLNVSWVATASYNTPASTTATMTPGAAMDSVSGPAK